MFTRTKRHYEVLAYTNPTREPWPTEKTTRKADALRIGAGWAVRFPRVEVNVVYTAADDENDIFGADLVAAWENGKKTTK